MNDDGCTGCSVASTRRDFLRDGLALAIGALATLGLSHDAAGMTFRFAAGRVAAKTVTYPLPPSQGVTIDRSSQVILVRWEAAVYAFALSCPHQNTALRWVEDSARFQCPKHKSKYSPDGTFQSGRATRGMDRYSIHRDGDSVVVDLDALFRQTDDEAAWEAAFVKLD
jgi:nitrite reductase/ring-hydroxylating ferredoxin subunit